jgi:hypothetical protein
VLSLQGYTRMKIFTIRLHAVHKILHYKCTINTLQIVIQNMHLSSYIPTASVPQAYTEPG